MTFPDAQKEFATRFHCWANRLHPAWTNTPPGLLSIMMMCRLFFKEAPKMLEGMEFETIELPQG